MTEDRFFTSDLHFFHESILTLGSGRPFDSTEEMNEALIANWNSTVTKGAQVYLLGDVSFGRPDETREILTRLRGQIHIVRGNHDSNIDGVIKKDKPRNIASYSPYKEIRIDGTRVVLMHYPLAEWNGAHRGAIHLHGHQHGNGAPTTLPRLDVGVDCFDYRPVSWETVREIMSTREWTPQSHH